MHDPAVGVLPLGLDEPERARDVTRLGTGQYLVEFTSIVRDCGWLATINDSDAGTARAQMIAVERDRPGSNLDLRVRTYDSDGTPADLESDDAFTLQVLC